MAKKSRPSATISDEKKALLDAIARLLGSPSADNLTAGEESTAAIGHQGEPDAGTTPIKTYRRNRQAKLDLNIRQDLDMRVRQFLRKKLPAFLSKTQVVEEALERFLNAEEEKMEKVRKFLAQ